MAGTLHEDQYTYLIVSLSVLGVRNIKKNCREYQNTHLISSNFWFFESLIVYDIMWKNIVERGRPQMTIWCMRVACWIPKATDRHSEYVILIAFALQQYSHDRASVLGYTYIAVLC
jgi:hypothetical protein